MILLNNNYKLNYITLLFQSLHELANSLFPMGASMVWPISDLPPTTLPRALSALLPASGPLHLSSYLEHISSDLQRVDPFLSVMFLNSASPPQGCLLCSPNLKYHSPNTLSTSLCFKTLTTICSIRLMCLVIYYCLCPIVNVSSMRAGPCLSFHPCLTVRYIPRHIADSQ